MAMNDLHTVHSSKYPFNNTTVVHLNRGNCNRKLSKTFGGLIFFGIPLALYSFKCLWI